MTRAFTATDAIRSPWGPGLKAQAIRLFVWTFVGYAALVVATVIATVAFGWSRHPLALLTVVSFLGSAGSALGTAFVIKFHVVIGAIIRKTAFFIFLGAILGAIVFAWAVWLLFGCLDDIAATQSPAALAVQTTFGGGLALDEIQAYLLGAGEGATRALGPPDEASWWATGGSRTVAWLLWPFQFRLLRDLLLAFGMLAFVAVTASFGIWWERKVAGRIQSRLGPMRVGGWHGWAQGIADGLKLIQKEDIYLAQADRPMVRFAPYLVFIPVLAAYIALPFGTTWAFRDLDVALLFILAMVGVDVVGVILGGWASNNKWSLYGAIREGCQMVSYEIPMGMSLLIPVMTVGTMKLSEFGTWQSGGLHSWVAFANPFTFVAAFTYFIASLASCKRAPFDLPEAESELVGGFHVEYSGFRWAVFFFGEYAAMFLVNALAVILFFGAWNSPLPAAWGSSLAEGPWWQQTLHSVLFSGPLWFIGKAYGLLYIQIWLRWTLPRIRIDQVMYACVQVLLPMTMVLLLGGTFWSLLVPAGSWLALTANIVCTLLGALLMIGFVVIAASGYRNRRHLAGSLVVDHLPGS